MADPSLVYAWYLALANPLTPFCVLSPFAVLLFLVLVVAVYRQWFAPR